MSDYSNLDELLPDQSEAEVEKLSDYCKLLVQYNSKLNLLSKNTISRLGSKHISDCVQALELIRKELNSDVPAFDFGSGNGLPGIVGAILYPELDFYLVERDLRKAEFLKIAFDELELTNVEVIDKDLSQLADDSCSQVISRAMAPIPKFLLEARKRMPTGGRAFLFKGDYWSTELSSAPPQVFEYWEVDLFGNYSLPNSEGERFIIECKRI